MKLLGVSFDKEVDIPGSIVSRLREPVEIVRTMLERGDRFTLESAVRRWTCDATSLEQLERGEHTTVSTVHRVHLHQREQEVRLESELLSYDGENTHWKTRMTLPVNLDMASA